MKFLPVGLKSLDALFLFFRRERFVGTDFIDVLVDAAAQNDIGTAPCHVGGNRHGAGTSGFKHNLCFTFVLLGV